ncbi:succinate dehydrogenase, flavoprotein subunit [Deferribacter desulfuricans SSM1]|uniref:Succinate dehydrogenase flavoprotein subunit n=1 Tax=Deferribacter desulfuricans (strain DSM 14783 / JCM 11476 / NBRC 101012 / SSM1) TaxID=639282 RepID=D3PC43_DEFDS|nr:succinate dehydrogenase flavoprotein subunit [Deferribacter desulfuricans]BAI80166.1 succinate dehydrogenase, flavoprotein subunit [Deferribacter desulfuricans SSM1]
MSVKVEYHKFDVIILGAGGAGLNAAQVASQYCKTAVISEVYPTRSHTISAQGGISAALGNLEEDHWHWHMFDTVKGSDYLADQDACEYMTKLAPEMIIELEHIGLPFSRTPEGKIAQRPFGGHTAEFGKRPVKRACYAADRTGHAMLQTLYEKSVAQGTHFFSEFYALELLTNDGAVNGVLCWDIQNGGFHIFHAKAVVFATGGSGRIFKTNSNAHINTGDGIAMAMRAGYSWCDAEFFQFHPTGIYGAGNLITEGVRGEGGILLNANGERFMERYAPTIKDLAPRDIVSRSMMREILEGRGVGPNKDHILLKIDHIGADAIMEKLPGIHELALVFAGVDCTKEPIPVVPTAHYQNGGIPTNYLTQVVKAQGENPEEPVPGFFAAGECAAASVHGANRLGTNSLLDLVVFGRTAGEQAAKWAQNNKLVPLKDDAGDFGIKLFQKFANSNGKYTFGPIYNELIETMQKNVSVFRTEEGLKEALEKLDELEKKMDDFRVNDKSNIYNLELIEALELNNMIMVAKALTKAALERKESRGGHYRDDYPERDDENYLKHTEVFYQDGEFEVKYRPVRMKPLTVDPFPPKPRVY